MQTHIVHIIQIRILFCYFFFNDLLCFCPQLGVVVPTHALTLPEEPITGPGEYWCNVTVSTFTLE